MEAAQTARSLEAKIAPKGDESRSADSQVGHADLKLERAYLPADERRSRCRKKDMKCPGPQSCDANREQQHP